MSHREMYEHHKDHKQSAVNQSGGKKKSRIKDIDRKIK